MHSDELKPVSSYPQSPAKNLHWKLVLACLTACGTVSGAPLPETQSNWPADYRILIDRIVKERAATPEDEILRFAGLIRSSVSVNAWNGWQDQHAKSVILNAAVQHPDWSTSYSTIDFAKALADESKGALLPQFSGGVDYGNREFGNNPITRASATKYTSSSMQLNVRQLLYDGFSRWDAWKSSEKKAEAQSLRAEIQQSEVLFKLLEANLNKQRYELQKFWVIKFNEQRKKTAEKITKRYQLGASTIFDIARSELKTHDAGVSLEQINQQYKNALGVVQEFDLPANLNLPVIAENISVSSHELDSIVANHPIIREATLLIDAVQLELTSAKSKRNTPQINLEVYRGARDFSGRSQNTYDSSLLVTLTHNIYSGGTDSAKLSQTNSKLQQAKDDLTSREKVIRTTLTRTTSEVNALFGSLKFRQMAVDSGLASFAATSKSFEVNRGNLTDFQRVEDDLNEKIKLLIDNWFDLSIAYFRHLHISNTLKTRFLSPHKLESQPNNPLL